MHSLQPSLQTLSSMGQCSVIFKLPETCIASAGHESRAHCDTCCSRNGNFNEVSTEMAVFPPSLVWENGTLTTLPKNGPVISLEIEAVNPSCNPSSPCCQYVACWESESALIEYLHFSHLSIAVSTFLIIQITFDTNILIVNRG